MTERQQTPELKVIPAEELLDTTYLKDIHEDCVANVGNDGILNAGDGHKNIYNTYTTYTDAPDGQEGA